MNSPEDQSADLVYFDFRMRRFLLGSLDQKNQRSFEEKLFNDDEFETRLRLAELDLTDDYVFNRLKSSERRRFEQNFLVTGDRRKILDVSNALNAWCRRSSFVDWRPQIIEKIQRVFDLNGSRWRYLFASLIFLLVITTTWLITRDSRLASRFFPARSPTRIKQSAGTEEAQHSVSGTTPTHRMPSSEQPVHQLPVVLRAEELPQVIDISPVESNTIRFQLELQRLAPGPYDAHLVSNGQTVLSLVSLKPGANADLEIEIPTRVLGSGDYQINLTRVDRESASAVSTYYFRIR